MALHASLLALLMAQGIQKLKDELNTRQPHRFVFNRSAGHHLPTYMVQLYRNFKSNFSRPLDAMEQDAAKQADTVKSVMAKSKTWLTVFRKMMICASLMDNGKREN